MTDQYSLEFWFAQQIQRSPLIVEDCQFADLVYIPLLTVWAGSDCQNEDQQRRVKEFVSNVATFLPRLQDKPHFMTVARVLHFTGVDVYPLFEHGITVLTIEGDPSHSAIIEVPYPSAYHQHAGLSSNKFIQHALENKSKLVFQSFALSNHHNEDLALRQALHQACVDASGDCDHAIPKYAGDESKEYVMAFWQNASSAWFCMQPTGHSITRKSTFDCLLAGSIPVFFDIASVHHFPWSDMLDPFELVVLLNQSDVEHPHKSLVGIDMQNRQARIRKIAHFAHLYQYSLTPHSGLISWHNIDKIDSWDDAFTFALKAVLRRI